MFVENRQIVFRSFEIHNYVNFNFTGRIRLPALNITFCEVFGCKREGEINIAFQSALSGVAIIKTWQEIRRESNQESLTKEQEVRYNRKPKPKHIKFSLAAPLILITLKRCS